MRKAVAVIALAAGLSLLSLPLAYSLFDRTAEAERILDRFEFLTLNGNPARYLAEAETTRAGSAELVDQAIPRLASEAGIAESEFDSFVRKSFPALAIALREVPEADEFSVRYSEQLAAVDGSFQSVYDIPTSSLPLTAVPWLFLVAGLACLTAGLAALRTTGRAALLALLALGGFMVLAPLALGAPAKSADGEDVKDFASRGLTPPAASAAHDASTALDALVEETGDRTLPQLARRRGVTESDLNQELERDFPAAAKLLAEWDVIGPRLSRLAGAVSVSVQDFRSARKMPISAPVWLLLGAGLAMSTSAGIALVREQREQHE